MINKIGLKSSEKLYFISELGTLLKSGIPILDALDSLSEDTKGNLLKVINKVKNDILQGHTISQSIETLPNAFDHVTVNLVKAAEEAGTLETTLKDISENIRRDIEFSDKVREAFTYPAFVLVVFTGVMLTILIYVVPRVADVFERLRMELPLPTRILIWLSDFLLHYTGWFIALSVFIILTLLIIYKTKKRQLIDFIFALPLINTLAKYIDLALFTKSVALTLNAGIPIVESLELAKKTVYRKKLQNAIDIARDKVISGQSLSVGLKTTKKMFPPVMIRITEAGEQSGTLDASLLELANYFNNEVSKTLKALSTLLEPVMLVVMGVLVGGIMMAIIAPIYNLIGQIRGR